MKSPNQGRQEQRYQQSDLHATALDYILDAISSVFAPGDIYSAINYNI